MFIPNDMRDDMHREETAYSKRRMKTLFLLHGYTGAAYNWVPEYLAEKYNFAIVMPNGENSFWLDGLSTGRKFCTFVGEELVGYVRKTFGLAMDAQETYIMGFSMGGFGALHTAFAYPENFGKVGALSSALIVHEIAHMKEGGDNGVANYDYYHECFGDFGVVEESSNNPETLIKRLLEDKKDISEIHMCCGTEDFLVEKNRDFYAFLDNMGVEHTYYESSGNHDGGFWNEYACRFVKLMYAEESLG